VFYFLEVAGILFCMDNVDLQNLEGDESDVVGADEEVGGGNFADELAASTGDGSETDGSTEVEVSSDSGESSSEKVVETGVEKAPTAKEQLAGLQAELETVLSEITKEKETLAMVMGEVDAQRQDLMSARADLGIDAPADESAPGIVWSLKSIDQIRDSISRSILRSEKLQNEIDGFDNVADVSVDEDVAEDGDDGGDSGDGSAERNGKNESSDTDGEDGDEIGEESSDSSEKLTMSADELKAALADLSK